MKISAVKYRRLTGEEAYYIRIREDGKEEVLIKIGKKNYDKLSKMSVILEGRYAIEQDKF